MPRPVAEFRKPEIIQAAMAAMKKRGLPLPPYDTIASEAGLSRQLIRHYFADPEELMVAVCDGLAAVYRDRLMKGIIAADKRERLSVFLDFYFNALAKDDLAKPEDDEIYDAMFALAAGSDRVRRNLYEQYSLLHHTVAHEIQLSHPDLPQTACREIGFLFVSLMYGHWKMVASLGFSQRHNQVTRQAIDRLIASYKEHYEDPDLAEPCPS
ncbi:TetR/AcrR family transcriptional regulator [Pararhizobium haloflavum]|uniref:TetR/AcrR family transcriptional regulator n=1 Tax=Pararhizobium haloflavum TaxID=2037914 RepID=UPI000C19AD75|nr:TetR/AcrR family transcriptional regulator [Pararhizobium haloflavum]